MLHGATIEGERFFPGWVLEESDPYAKRFKRAA